MKSRNYLIILAISLLCAFVAFAGQPPKVGNALQVAGDAKIRRGAALQNVQPGMSLLGGDVIITGKKSKVSIEFTSGHVVDVGPESMLALDEPGAEDDSLASAMLQTGMVYVRKRPSKSPSAPFQIQTISAVAGVRGTAFTMAVAPDGNTRIGVEEGQVEIETDKQQKILVGMREGAEIDPANKAAPKVTEYLPERDNLESWLESRRSAILKNPLPAGRRITMSLAISLNMGEKLQGEVSALADKVLSEAQAAEKERVRGKAPEYMRHVRVVRDNMPELIKKLRLLIMLDNRIQAKGDILAWLVKEVSAPGSGAPPNAVQAVKTHYQTFAQLKDRADKLHQARSELLANRVPAIKDAIKFMK